MIAELTGTRTVRSQADAIALEQSVRRHVFAWWLGLDIFDRPRLDSREMRRLEQRVRDAEWECRWDDLEQAWTDWMNALRGA